MRPLLQLLCCIFWPGFLLGQSFAFPTFHKPVRSVADLLSPKWTLKDSAVGDLNRDQRQDMALVLEYADTMSETRPDSIENIGRPRILLILLRDSNDQTYHIAAQNNTFILRNGEGGMDPDPYDGISIKHDVLEIDYQFVRASLSYKFRFRSPTFYLIGASNAGASGESFEGWDFNFLTGQAKHTWDDMAKQKSPEHMEWKRIKNRTPVKLKDIKKPYMLQVFPDVYI